MFEKRLFFYYFNMKFKLKPINKLKGNIIRNIVPKHISGISIDSHRSLLPHLRVHIRTQKRDICRMRARSIADRSKLFVALTSLSILEQIAAQDHLTRNRCRD